MLALVKDTLSSPEALEEVITVKDVEFHPMIFEAVGTKFAGCFHQPVTFWALLLGNAVMILSTCSTDQVIVQRYVATRSRAP